MESRRVLRRTFWGKIENVEAGIILWEENILESDRKQKGWNNSLEGKILERDRKQKGWNNSLEEKYIRKR